MKLNKKGFTLAELLIVIAIIAILVAIAIPTFSSAKTKAENAACAANRRAAEAAIKVHMLTAQDGCTDTDNMQNYCAILKADMLTLVCPTGGTYTVKNKEVYCSKHAPYKLAEGGTIFGKTLVGWPAIYAAAQNITYLAKGTMVVVDGVTWVVIENNKYLGKSTVTGHEKNPDGISGFLKFDSTKVYTSAAVKGGRFTTPLVKGDLYTTGGNVYIMLNSRMDYFENPLTVPNSWQLLGPVQTT